MVCARSSAIIGIVVMMVLVATVVDLIWKGENCGRLLYARQAFLMSLRLPFVSTNFFICFPVHICLKESLPKHKETLLLGIVITLLTL